jgi:hypothetical protein
MASDRSSTLNWRPCPAASSAVSEVSDDDCQLTPAARSGAPPGAAVTARRVAAMEANFEQQLEMVEHRAQMAIATARLEATAEAEKAAQRNLKKQSEEFRAEMAELESQAEHALERSATADQETERNNQLAAQCDAQAHTIQELTAELAELAATRANDQRIQEQELAAKEADWSEMERDFIEKTMALENANRRHAKAEQRLVEAHAELEAMDESVRKLSQAAEYDKGLLDDRLRARLQARIMAVGKVHAQLLVDGQIWASAHFSEAAIDLEGDVGAANQRAQVACTATTEVDVASHSSSQRRNSVGTGASARSPARIPDLETALDLERKEAAEEISHLRKEIKYVLFLLVAYCRFP